MLTSKKSEVSTQPMASVHSNAGPPQAASSTLATMSVASKANKRLDISSSSERIRNYLPGYRAKYNQQTKLAVSASPP